jgi:hypothetical protein
MANGDWPTVIRMTTVFDQIEESKLRSTEEGGGKRVRPLIGAIVVGLALGYLGWVLPTPGGSVLIPTLVVAGVGVLVALVAGVFALHPHLRSLRVFCAGVLVLTIAASIWTYAFSLPASIAWDASATHQAQFVLARITAEPKTVNDIPRQACWTLRQGSVGSLPAPYRACGVSTPEGHFVIFTALGRSEGGLGYTDRGAATFPDACSRHLTGKWWAFSTDTNGEGGCPVGYRFLGGG